MSAPLALMLAWFAAAASTSSGDRSRAQRLVDHGATLYRRGDLEGALKKLEQAYAAYPSAKLWLNIGKLDWDLGRTVEAMHAFERFLATDTHSSPATFKAARAAIESLRSHLGRLRVDCDLDGAEISIDGARVGSTPLSGMTWVAPGPHVLTANSSTLAAARSTRIDIKEGETQTIVLQLEPPASAPPASPVAMRLPVEPAPIPLFGAKQTPEGWWLGRKWTWVTAGVALASAAGAVTFAILRQSKYDELNKSCGSASASRSGCSNGDLGDLDTRTTMTNLLLGVAGVAVVTTGLLWVVEGRTFTAAPVASGTTAGMTVKTSY